MYQFACLLTYIFQGGFENLKLHDFKHVDMLSFQPICVTTFPMVRKYIK